MLLKDKVAVITGGAGITGLGSATARQMAAQGARVVTLTWPAPNPPPPPPAWVPATWAWSPTSPTRPPAKPLPPPWSRPSAASTSS